MELNSARGKIIFTVTGNIVELYDYALFGLLSTFIMREFFYLQNSWLNIFVSMLLVSVSHIVRPVGGLLNSWLSRYITHEKILLSSTKVMIISSFVIAIMPSSQSIGVLSSVAILLARVLQGVSISGEFPATLIILSGVKNKSRDILLGLSFVSGIFGMILGHLTVFGLSNVLGEQLFSSWGWRLAFALGVLFGGGNLYLRKRYLTTVSRGVGRIDSLRVWRQIIPVFLISGLSSALFYTQFVYIPIIFKAKKLMPYNKLVFLLMISLMVYGASFVIYNYLYTKGKIKKYYDLFIVILLIFMYFKFYEVDWYFNNILIVSLMSSILISAVISRVPSVLCGLFEEDKRGIYIGYNLGVSIFGSLTPFVLSFWSGNFKVLCSIYFMNCIILLLVFKAIDISKGCDYGFIRGKFENSF